MRDHESNRIFREMTDQLAWELADKEELARQLDFGRQPRPMPEGLEQAGPPLGHIAFLGDFEQTLTEE